MTGFFVCALALASVTVWDPRPPQTVFAVKDKAPSLLPAGRHFRLAWHDEFDGDRLDDSKWLYRTNYMGERASWFAGPEDNTLEFREGVMHMRLKRRADGSFCSASLQTGNRIWDEPVDPAMSDRGANGFRRWPYFKREPPKFTHRYGYYECRCRLQRKPGWWSAFWMQAVDIGCTLDPGKSGVEMDIMESFVPGEVIPHCFHYNGYGPDYGVFVTPRMKKGEKPKTSPHILKLGSDDFHVFGLLWEPDGYTVFVDGMQHGEKVGTGKGEVVSQTDEFLMITTEAMNYKKNGTKDPRLDEALDDDFAVDYVRVFDIVEDGWRPDVKAALDKLVERNRGNKDAYAVFDFDYTTAIGDLSYSCLWRLLETMDIRTDENLMALLSPGVPRERLGMLSEIVADMERMRGRRRESLPEMEEWGRFAARYWKFYRLLFREQGSAFACEWRNRIFAGYSPAELRNLAHDAVVRNLAKGGLSRDRNVPSELRGLAFPHELKVLFRRLREAGIKVYIVSATMRDFLLAATGPDFGLDFDPDCVFGSNLKLGDDGRYLPVFNEAGVKSGDKANFIRKTIAWRHHGAEPVLAAGDSMGDYDMLTGFPALQAALVFDRCLEDPLLAQLIASAPASGGKVLVQTRDEVCGVLIPAGGTVKP